MQELNQSKTSLPSSPGRNSSYNRSCTQCNRRKVRCDKNDPCGRCVKGGERCVFPEPKRAPRKLRRPPISEVVARLRQLEEEVEGLRSGSPAGDHDVSSSVSSRSDALHTNNYEGRFIVKEGKSRYVGDEASAVLGDKIRELQDICSDSSSEEDFDEPDASALRFVSVLGNDWIPDVLHSSYLDPSRIQELWRVYKINVAPLIATLNRPSVDEMVCQESENINPDPAREALLLSVCYAVIVSMDPKQCLEALGENSETSIQKYRFATDQALVRANFIKSQNIHVLQAAVLFLLCLRRKGDTRLVWAASAVVVRVAQGQGLHRDGQYLGLSPFDAEIRRRIWWHICILDMLCSGDQGTDSQIQPGMFDTRLPSNCEVIANLYWPNKPIGANLSRSGQENRVKPLANRLEDQYLKQLDLDVPEPDDEAFNMAIEVVKFAHLLHTNESTSQWAWLSKSYKQWHVIAFILSELCACPITPETNHAWEVVTEVYRQWEEDDTQTSLMLRKFISRLMERAAQSRAAKIGVALSSQLAGNVSFMGAPLGELASNSEILSPGMEWLWEPLL
ncbi:uncharacterized protein ASPGLDRAFT_74065 [Aspergillus glaucus CBS 516.65]|uniref:Zn(2)-C6 fungal-type domain-containing protein n=1 Tax=Aspergillus glaucus CBS 516.65 TaxID=1160497 RepID=A0A1L9VL78_ASPGL|nr:hypothetical protein ASPGLDRAFT_74065 [Aspergillus glaucus CBS 516.65]OJJ84645.1 hypothetical protein ASPGLDRAFT_74065 [Aspergillus glaucus CBS 516.65]